MLEDLDNIYSKFNLYNIVDIRLYNFDFDIKKNKIFNRFLIRYITIIALL